MRGWNAASVSTTRRLSPLKYVTHIATSQFGTHSVSPGRVTRRITRAAFALGSRPGRAAGITMRWRLTPATKKKAFLYAWSSNNSRELIITIHSRYEKFYRRRIFFEKIGPERNYAKVNGEPTVLLKLSLSEGNRLRRTRRIFPFNIITCSDQRDLELTKQIENQVQPMTDEEFFTFFIEKTDTWEKTLPQHKEFIKSIYPANDIDHNEIARLLAREFSKKHHLYASAHNNPLE